MCRESRNSGQSDCGAAGGWGVRSGEAPGAGGSWTFPCGLKKLLIDVRERERKGWGEREREREREGEISCSPH